MASEPAAPQPRVTGEAKRSAEEDQAQLDRISLFLEERRRRRRRGRAAAVTTVTAGMLLLAALGGWHLRDRGTKATSAASDSSPAVTRPMASPVRIGTARAEIGGVATRLPTAPSVSYEQKPAAKLSSSARAPLKAVKHAQTAVPPPQFLKRAHPPRETLVMQPTGQPAPGTAILPAEMEGSYDGSLARGATPMTGVRLDDDRRAPRSPTRTVAPSPGDSPVDPRRFSGVESP